MTRGHIVIVLAACGGRTIGENAVVRAEFFARKYDVTVVSDVFPDIFPESVGKITVKPAQFNYLRRFCHVPNDFGFVMAVKKAVLKLHTLKPVSFILCHSYSLTHFVGRHMGNKHGIKYGMFMHGHIFSRPRGTYDPRITAYYRRLAPGCYRNTHIVFSLSTAQLRLAVSAGADPDNVRLSPNGIEPGQIGVHPEQVRSAMASRFCNDEVKLLYVGRCTPEKGFHVLLDACEKLIQSGRQFRLQIVGGNGMSEADSKRIKNENFKYTVDVSAPVRRELLGQFYLKSDILCVPSIDEPLGNVVLEGMASGCLVVASETGGIPDMITNGETGYLFETGNPDQLENSIVKCLDDKNSSLEIIENARLAVAQNFVWEKILLRTESDITSVVGNALESTSSQPKSRAQF